MMHKTDTKSNTDVMHIKNKTNFITSGRI